MGKGERAVGGSFIVLAKLEEKQVQRKYMWPRGPWWRKVQRNGNWWILHSFGKAGGKRGAMKTNV